MERNIYKIGKELFITSDEEIKEDGDWYYNTVTNAIFQMKYLTKYNPEQDKKIILTTDQDLIKYGIQPIDDTFLEWFVKNPSCERVEVKIEFIQTPDNLKDGFYYKIIIPQQEDEQEEEEVECNMCDSLMSYDEENGIYICTNSECTRCYEEYEEEPKQETIEEAAVDYISEKSERAREYGMVFNAIRFGAKWQAERMCEIMNAYADDVMGGCNLRAKEWFEQFKKK
jgi:hypothetical protein